MRAMRCSRKSACARVTWWLLVMSVSQRSKTTARIISSSSSSSLWLKQSPQRGRRGRRTSLQLHTTPEAVVITMKILEGFFGVLPAVIAAAVVEIDQPESFDLDAHLHDRLRPHGDNALRLIARRVAGQSVDLVDGRGRQTLDS